MQYAKDILKLHDLPTKRKLEAEGDWDIIGGSHRELEISK